MGLGARNLQPTNSLFFALFFFVSFTSEVAAWVDGEGGEGGCCVYPQEVQTDIDVLRRSFRETAAQDLLDQQFVGRLCANHTCGSLSEDQASRFLDRERAAAERRTASRNKSINLWIAVFGLLVATGGLIVSVFALRQSVRNERDIGHLQTEKVLSSEKKHDSQEP